MSVATVVCLLSCLVFSAAGSSAGCSRQVAFSGPFPFATGTYFTGAPSQSVIREPASNQQIDDLEALVTLMESRWEAYDDACAPNAPFALTYLYMTKQVTAWVAQCYFDYNGAMADFTQAFARRYIDAVDAYLAYTTSAGPAPTAIWLEAFLWGAAGDSSVLQDMFLGMNAHINYDLALVVYQTGVSQIGLRNYKYDYNRINDAIASVLNPVYGELAARYDASFTINPVANQAIAALVITWREQAWQTGFLYQTALTSTLRNALVATSEVYALTVAQPFQTPNGAGAAATRLAFCQAHQ